MSMNTITKIYRKEGYAETTYICSNCGAEIAKFRDYGGDTMITDWSIFQYCGCGERLVREVIQIVPDISESKVIEVKEDVKE